MASGLFFCHGNNYMYSLFTTCEPHPPPKSPFTSPNTNHHRTNTPDPCPPLQNGLMTFHAHKNMCLLCSFHAIHWHHAHKNMCLLCSFHAIHWHHAHKNMCLLCSFHAIHWHHAHKNMCLLCSFHAIHWHPIPVYNYMIRTDFALYILLTAVLARTMEKSCTGHQDVLMGVGLVWARDRPSLGARPP